MATSGSFNFAESSYGSGTGYPCYAKIDWSATWSDSSMLWTVNWSATAQGGSTSGRWATVFSGSVTVTDGTNTLQTKSMPARIEQAKNNTVLLSGSFTVGTNSSGNRNLAFSGEFQFETTAASGKSSGSQTFALDTKAMASTISSVASNVTVGSSGGSSTVSISRKSSSYTHTVVWTFGSNTHTETGVATSKSYTIPASWLATIPNAASGSAMVKVTTFNGSTQIGQPATASFTITAGVSPTIGSLSVAQSGNPSGITQYVAGKTAAKITASSVAGVQGSTIKKVEFIRDGAVLSSNTTPTYTYTTGTLTGSSATFSVRVTDSRGATATKAASAITIHAYALPTISANAFRSNSSGTATADGTYIRITASATATPSSNSITALTYATKATTASSYSSEANVGSGVTKSGFSNTTSYDVRIKATDKLGGVAYKYFTIPTASYTMDFKVGGKGVAFGKVAETDNLVDSEWNIRSAGQIWSEKATGDGLSAAIVAKCQTSAAITAYNVTNGNYIELVDGSSQKRGLYSNDGWIMYFDTDGKIYFNKPVVSTNLPVASATEAGIVSTGSQTFGGLKAFANGISTQNTKVNGAQVHYAFTDFLPGTRLALHWMSWDANTGAYFTFGQYSANSDGSASTGYRENFRLPRPNKNRTTNATYDILTTKSAVTVEQGGTGATNAATARSNLGLGSSANLLSGTLVNTETTLKDARQFSALVVYGKPTGGSLASMTIPMSAIGTSFEQWQLADNSGYRTFQVKYSGNDVIIKGVAATSNASITGVRGII